MFCGAEEQKSIIRIISFEAERNSDITGGIYSRPARVSKGPMRKNRKKGLQSIN